MPALRAGVFVLFASIVLASTAWSAAAEPAGADDSPPPMSPEESLAAIVTRPGMHVELVAAEPLVVDPVAFDFGPDGRLWVVEMGDYPLGLDNAGKPGGRVRWLEDVDGDGRFDRSKIFLEGLTFPTGILYWHGGVLVTSAPDIVYAADTNDDGLADVREVLYTGFAVDNPQHVVNGLRRGLDNWIYCSNGDGGGVVESKKTGEQLNIAGRDVRLRPESGLIDTQAGRTQFLRVQDDWGNWFGASNSDPMYQYVLADHYLRRNTHVAAPESKVSISVTPGAAYVYPASHTMARFNDLSKTNRFTSACSAIVYRDELLGPEFAGNSFVCEPVHNLVHREIMQAEGVRFTSHRADDEQDREFLASKDNWFRPAMVRTGPDGALWIADIYRLVIEHPQWIPAEWMARLDVRAGSDRGRIYRVYAEGNPPRRVPRLDRLNVEELVAALESPNGTLRDMVQQRLIELADRAAVTPLERLAAHGERATARVHALATLDGLGAVTPKVLESALADEHPGVRRHAVRIAEAFCERDAELARTIVRMADDGDAQLRLQRAYTLGFIPSAEAGRALGRLLVAAGDDRYTRAAALSSLNAKNLAAAVGVITAEEGLVPSEGLVESLASTAVALEDDAALAGILRWVTYPDESGYAAWKLAAVGGLLDAFDRDRTSLAALRRHANPAVREALAGLDPLFDFARSRAFDESQEPADRAAAARLLGRDAAARDADVDALARLLAPQTPGALQTAVIEHLARLDDARVPAVLLAGWKGYAPAIRSEVLAALGTRNAGTVALLDALESGQVAAAELDAVRRQQLLVHRDPKIRRRAESLLAGAIDADRQAVVDRYLPVAMSSGDAARGANVFKKRCSTCHRLGEVGTAVGPDLMALTDRSPQTLLVAMLDPNRAVESKFTSYTAVTTGGLVYTGMLAEETGQSVTLLAAEGKQVVVLRSELEELVSSAKSLMPEGLEKDVSVEEAADVVAFLRANRPPRKEFAGNHPQTVEPEGLRGEFYMLAKDASIYGTTLTFEPRFENLGTWQNADDHAVWTMHVTQAGRYDVSLEYACDDAAKGDGFQLLLGGTRLEGSTVGTGGWDVYSSVGVGAIDLEPGMVEVVLRAAEKPRDRLMDFKTVRIRPAR